MASTNSCASAAVQVASTKPAPPVVPSHPSLVPAIADVPEARPGAFAQGLEALRPAAGTTARMRARW